MNIVPPNNLDSTPDFLKELEQWIAWICYNMREGSDDFFPMKLSVFKVTYGKKIENFNIFLPSISKFCDTFYNSIEDVFIIDEEDAIKFLQEHQIGEEDKICGHDNINEYTHTTQVRVDKSIQQNEE